MKWKLPLAAAALIGGFLAAAMSTTPAAESLPPDDFTLDGAILGKQLTGPAVDLEDCEGRVSVFFIWGIT